jgi:hypothetical protein
MPPPVLGGQDSDLLTGKAEKRSDIGEVDDDIIPNQKSIIDLEL